MLRILERRAGSDIHCLPASAITRTSPGFGLLSWPSAAGGWRGLQRRLHSFGTSLADYGRAFMAVVKQEQVTWSPGIGPR